MTLNDFNLKLLNSQNHVKVFKVYYFFKKLKITIIINLNKLTIREIYFLKNKNLFSFKKHKVQILNKNASSYLSIGLTAAMLGMSTKTLRKLDKNGKNL